MKIISFYLPQFHEVKENNEWWGRGFTEWTNVKKAKVLYQGHNQPRRPFNKNYYDLSDVSVMRWQIDLAREYGLYGFCFYHYWFNGKLLLEKPIENYLNDKTLEFPFCLCWANENWTNGWVSAKNDILISHDNRKREDWKKHFEYLLKFFKDRRYIFIDDKPVLIIYYPTILSDLEEMLNYWNQLALKNNLKGINFIYQHPRFHFDKNANKRIFSYGIEFQPQYAELLEKSKMNFKISKLRTSLSSFLQKNFNIYIHINQRNLKLYDYDKIWKKILVQTPDNEKMFPGAFVDWDNTPRRGIQGSCYTGVTPEKFEYYMKKQIKNARDVYKKDYLFLFAWNEWAEGGYLEPDEKNGFLFLKSIRNALESTNELPY